MKVLDFLILLGYTLTVMIEFLLVLAIPVFVIYLIFF